MADRPKGRLILKVSVDLGLEPDGAAPSSETPVILVHENDDAQTLAVQFCAEHGLHQDLVLPLAAHIIEKMTVAQATPPSPAFDRAPPAPPAPHGRAAARRTEAERQVHFFRNVSNRQRQAASAESTPKQRCCGTESRGSRSTAQATAAQGNSPRFLRLFEDSIQRRFRLQRLKHQVEKDEEQRAQSAMTPTPGRVRYAAWERRSGEPKPAVGERLYNDAARRALKMRHLQEMREELERQQEQQEATFRPAIEASQRRCQGTSRSSQDPAGLKTRKKMDRLRDIKQKNELDGCTFKPEIDQRSEELISQRLARLKITGTLYDSLYEDAVRRRERQLESTRVLPPGVTFQPDIGLDPNRPSSENKEDFINRLAYSKSYSDRWVSLRRQKQEQERQLKDLDGQPEFHPRTGRGPLVERNKYGLPIGDFLYEHAREKASSSQAQEPQPSTPRMGENSRQLFEETKQRTYKQLFDLLTCKDSEGQLQAETICLDGLDSDLRAFLQPMVSFLDSSQHRMEFEAFCAALDYQRQHAVMPTAHLFTQRNSRGKEKANPETPVPKIDQNSVRLASKRRSRSVPLHVQLFRERDVRDARMEERRLLAEEAELQECTFRPRVGRHNGRSWSSRSFRQDSPGVNSSPSSSPQVQSFEPSRSTGAAPAPRTPRGPGAPGGPGVATVAASTPRPEGSLGLATPTSGLDSLRGER